LERLEREMMNTIRKQKPKEKEKFERTMIALFRVPKSVVTKKIKNKPKKGKD
jgi:hypothetical protein